MSRVPFFLATGLALVLMVAPLRAQETQVENKTPESTPPVSEVNPFQSNALNALINTNPLENAPAPSLPPASFDASHALVQQAGRWSNYHTDVHYWGSRNIGSVQELETALMDFSRYDGAAIAPGWMATGALMALQVPEYVAGIQQWEQQYGREVLLERLHQNPMFSLMFPGAKQAEKTILRAAKSDANRIKLVGSLFKEQSYSMQKHAWANRKQTSKDVRINTVTFAPQSPKDVRQETLHALAAPGINSLNEPYDSEKAKNSFLSALKLGPRSAWAQPLDLQTDPKTAAGREFTLARMLGLTALLVLKEEKTHPDFRAWTDDVELRECVDWSRVHLKQCLAAGHFEFESSFCIAEHQLISTSECISDVISGSRAASPDPH